MTGLSSAALTESEKQETPTHFTEDAVHTPPDDLILANLPKSDLGNARRLLMRMGDGLRFVPRLGWRSWDGQKWASDDEGESGAQRAAHDTADAIYAEVEAIDAKGKYETEEPKDFEKRLALHRRWAADSGNAGRTRAMLAQLENYVRLPRDQWDKDELTLNVRNGTLKFTKTEDGMDTVLHKHCRSDFCTQIAGCDYDKDAKAPMWDKHLELCIPDPERRAYFQRFMGYCLTGFVSEQMFLIMQGGGADGKSTTINALAHMMGGYSMQVDIKSFIQNDFRGGADASPDIARLAGPARFVSLSEPKRGAKLDESAIKTMTGGDKITARKLRQDIFEFFPVYKMAMPCNPLPIITSSDHGTWRRIKLMEWVHRISDADKDWDIDAKLRAEAPGILNWAIEGLSDWLHERLNEPMCIRRAVQTYKGESDPITLWMEERCEVGHKAGREELSVLYDDYEAWSEKNSLNAIPSRAFSANLTTRQMKSDRQGGKTFKVGISFKDGVTPEISLKKNSLQQPIDDGEDPGDLQDTPPPEAYDE